mgnify:CR=1 FL=1|tara:strand:+ start:341 stop:1090 length:750 start_codon:yes stop_codon:yes gene_type:complete
MKKSTDKKTPTQPKKKRRKKSKIYFGQKTQDAIIKYNDSNNTSEKNKIYNEIIHPAFDKLAENIINTFKFSYFDSGFEDIKHETVCFLVLNIHKYDHTKGFKAFSYFSVVAKNYLILHNNNNYKRYKVTDKLDSLNYDDSGKYYAYHDSKNKHYNDFMKEIIKYFENNIPLMFRKKRDIDISFAILELMNSRKDIENFNKKALYLLIREMTGVDTNHITKVMNVFRSHYKKLMNEFSSNGQIDVNKVFF